MAISVMSSPYSIPKKTYDVFISFRGEDTRYGFTSYLHEALRERKIKTYLDEEHLNRGEEISPGLRRAIEESQLSLIIFSENYASSSWCLDEVLHILWCKENDQQQVVPIFYKVNPSDVRKQLGSYKEAFDKHEERFKAKVQSWRLALEKAASLSGFSTQDGVLRSEPKLVKAIVEDIIKKLNGVSTVFVDSENLVGIEQPVKQIESLLQLDLLDVRVVGLWGRAGIGKTTLAEFMFWKLCCEFDGRCFLENVREEWEKCRGRYYLIRNKIFSTLLGEKDINLDSRSVMPSFWIERLQRTKSLIVLDNVNDKEQLETLVGRREWFGYGSRIIVTSRDSQSLPSHLVDAIYEVKGLSNDEACRLFEGNSHVQHPAYLLEDVVRYAEGIPLVLQVLRSLFNSNGKGNWGTLLDKLKNSRHGENIRNALMISYNDLDKMQKSVFLDIACFFKGFNRHKAESILEDGVSMASTIDDLVSKSLITINHGKQLCMHDLVQEMGLEVIKKESSKPGKRSRLWNTQDICHVFRNNKATRAIEGISLDMSKLKEVRLKPDAFLPTENLRILKIYDSCYSEKCCKVYLPEGLQYLPDKLRYLHWEAYPAMSLPSNFAPEKLVHLNISHSQVERLWDGVQNLGSLRTINLSYSMNLIEVPDLSQAPNLQLIEFDSCPNLLHVPSHKFPNLERLVYLSMESCEKLRCLPDSIQSVEFLNLSYCGNLKIMPEIKKENVSFLSLRDSGIEELPASIGSFVNLKNLFVSDCKSLKKFPSSIDQLKLLTDLDLHRCLSLEKVPDILPRALETLNMSETAIEEVPSSIGLLSYLQYLNLTHCKRLRSLPTSICKLKSLVRLDLDGCTKFEEFPEILEPMEMLNYLDLSRTAIRTLPSSIQNLVVLNQLKLRFCKKLEFFPSSIYKLERLEFLAVSGISKHKKWPFPEVERFSSLRELELSHCNMSEIPDNGLNGFESTDELYTSAENDLDGIHLTIAGLSNVKVLSIRNWKNPRSLSELPCNLETFEAVDCMSLESVASSRDVILQGYLDRTDRRYFSVYFIECLKLDQNALDNIIADGQLRIFLSALSLWHQSKEAIWPTDFETRETVICYPGNEIPEWFPHQATGSSMDIINRCSNCWTSQFLGFAVCFVVSFKGHSYNDIEFKFQLSDHVFMCYKYFAKNFGAAEGGSIEVSIGFRPCVFSHIDYKKDLKYTCEVKKCGIRPLHLEDAEKLGIYIPPDCWSESHRQRTFDEITGDPYETVIAFQDSATETEEGQGKRYNLTLQKRKLTDDQLAELRDLKRSGCSDLQTSIIMDRFAKRRACRIINKQRFKFAS